MRLTGWLKQTGMSKSEFARRVGVSRTSVYQWLGGKAIPHKKTAVKIYLITNKQVILK